MYLNYEDRRIAHARTASRKSNIKKDEECTATSQVSRMRGSHKE